MIDIKQTDRGLIFKVYVQPRSSKIAITGCHQNAIKLKLTAPPVSGAANKQCLQVLAKALALPKSALTITGGQKSRMKTVCIHTKELQMGVDEAKRVEKKLSRISSKSE